MRVLRVIGDGTIGGAEVHLLASLRSLRKQEKSDAEVCVCFKPGLISNEIEKEGIKVHYLNMRRGFDFLRVFKLFRLVRRGNYDLVHSHTNQPLIFTTILLSRPNKLVLSEHGTVFFEEKGKGKLSLLFNRLCWRFVDSYHAVSNATKAKMAEKYKIPARKICVIHNGLDLLRFSSYAHDSTEERRKLGIPERALVVGTVCRLVPVKRVEHFLLAAAEVLAVHPNCFFVVVGEGPEGSKLRQLAKQLGISAKTIFLGDRWDVPAIISTLDVFVLASASESLGIVALEAAAMGKATVAYRVGGLPEVVENGKTGFLLEQTTPHSLAEKIALLLGDTKLRERMGEAGMRKVRKEFEISNILTKYQNLYESLLMQTNMVGNQELVSSARQCAG